jgi:NCAIR mutase (PurE)-related protein
MSDFEIDYQREKRQGLKEVIYGESKNETQISEILQDMYVNNQRDILITRLSEEKYNFIKTQISDIEYTKIAKIAVAFPTKLREKIGNIIVASAGTSDVTVCEEAAITAEVLGNNVNRMYDIGVAGIHRLLSKTALLQQANVIIAVAGMEGALPGVIAGLVSCPVIAVPTSVGYGANFGGLAALLAMLNSCAVGVSVVNIDNGFGAGALASRINKLATL